MSYLIEVRGLKLQRLKWLVCVLLVVSYRGTWIETHLYTEQKNGETVVSYRGTWIETGYLGQ